MHLFLTDVEKYNKTNSANLFHEEFLPMWADYMSFVKEFLLVTIIIPIDTRLLINIVSHPFMSDINGIDMSFTNHLSNIK